MIYKYDQKVEMVRRQKSNKMLQQRSKVPPNPARTVIVTLEDCWEGREPAIPCGENIRALLGRRTFWDWLPWPCGAWKVVPYPSVTGLFTGAALQTPG